MFLYLIYVSNLFVQIVNMIRKKTDGNFGEANEVSLVRESRDKILIIVLIPI